MQIKVITPPAEEAVSLSAARAFIRAGHSDEDALIQTLVAAAQADVEHALGVRLVTQTVSLILDGWPRMAKSTGAMPVRPWPVRTLEGVFSYDAQGDQSDVTGAFRLESGDRPRLVLNQDGVWPDPGRRQAGVQIVLGVGFGAASDVPADFQQAILTLADLNYRHRGDADTTTATAREEILNTLHTTRGRVRL